jgi:hypothetical protein
LRSLVEYLRRVRNRQVVRPWALATPVLVLLVALPLLRPLRQPDPFQISDEEMSRLATVQAIVEHHTLAIDQTQFSRTHDAIVVGDRTYSDQMPVLAFLLSGSYWIMYRVFGLTFANSPVLAPYLLTLLGVALPVALGTGLVYRMARVFELSRPWRMALALGAAFATGMISYAVVLNGYAPAGALLLAAAACLLHASNAPDPSRTGGWLAGAGFCAALAGVIELSAAPFVVLMMAVVLSLRLPVSLKIGGTMFFLLGCTPAIVLHLVLTMPVTGSPWPGAMHPELSVAAVRDVPLFLPSAAAVEGAELVQAGVLSRTGARIAALASVLLGARGVFSHFPVIVLGLVGIGAIMHRHWPGSIKILACGCAAGGALVLLFAVVHMSAERLAHFAMPTVVLALPLVLFWAGAWLRRRHHPVTWAVAGILLVTSMTVSLLGAGSGPYLSDSPDGHSAIASAKRLVQPLSDPVYRPVLAER